LGYGLFNLKTENVTTGGVPQSLEQTSGGRGWFGTVVGGYDYQFTDRIVAGVFADFDFSDIKGHLNDAYWETSGSIKQKWAWAAGARLGYLVAPTVLSYFNAGFTQARFSESLQGYPDGNSQPGHSLTSQTYNGWFIGSGVEAMVFPGWFVRSEYRFADYGAETIPLVAIAPCCSNGNAEKIHPYVQTVRTDLIYRFNWSDPMRTGLAASAAALPVKAPPRPSAIAAPVNWTGFYIGGGIGYGMFNLETEILETIGRQSLKETSGGRGWLGTMGVGYDHQFTDRIVAGVFADFDLSDIRGHLVSGYWESSGPIKQSWAWAAGGRLGYLVVPNVLSYVDAGFTQAHFTQTSLFYPSIPPCCFLGTVAAQTYNGWFIGGGAEAMVPWFPGLSVKSEYRFADYQSETIPIVENIPLRAFAKIHPFVQTVRSALVYRFSVH
jgi:outer membrane immunogenic protein